MLGPNATWGDVRKIYEKSLQSPDQWFEDNILADPEVMKYSQDKADNELLRQPGVLLGEDAPNDEDGLGEIVEFGIIVDGAKVRLLVRTDYQAGTMAYRNDGQWVEVGPEDDVPLLDDFPLTRVTGEAVDIFDRNEENLKTEQFKTALLDG